MNYVFTHVIVSKFSTLAYLWKFNFVAFMYTQLYSDISLIIINGTYLPNLPINYVIVRNDIAVCLYVLSVIR